MRLKKQSLLLIFVLLTLILAACSGGTGQGAAPAARPAAGGKLNIVATTGQVQDVAQNIVGDHGAVQVLLGKGVDPHLYVPVEKDLEAFQSADIILYSGLHLEARMIEIMEQIGQDRGIPVVAVTEAIPAEQVLGWVGDSGTPDPHIWGDVGRWVYVADAIRDVLIQADPAHAEAYRANHAAYTAQLRDLDAWAKASFATIPAGQRRLVTAHDAFQYLGDAYEIEVFAPQGISTQAEASVADIQAAVDYIVQHKIPAIFFESAIPIDTVEAMIAGAAAQGHTVVMGGELFADTMGEPGTPEGTYIGMVQHNVTTIVTALGGTVADTELAAQE
jgi:manganese/zinc/iron transport system substrate-binding protein